MMVSFTGRERCHPEGREGVQPDDAIALCRDFARVVEDVDTEHVHPEHPKQS